jgi:thiamine biosynthesis protein ThiI
MRIGTYPISIVPDQDCCTLFTPRNPLTRARLADVEAAERALPVEELVRGAVQDAVVEEYEFPGADKRISTALRGAVHDGGPASS